MPAQKLPSPNTSIEKHIQGVILLIISIIFVYLDFPEIALIPAILGVICFVIATSSA